MTIQQPTERQGANAWMMGMAEHVSFHHYDGSFFDEERIENEKRILLYKTYISRGQDRTD